MIGIPLVQSMEIDMDNYCPRTSLLRFHPTYVESRAIWLPSILITIIAAAKMTTAAPAALAVTFLPYVILIGIINEIRKSLCTEMALRIRPNRNEGESSNPRACLPYYITHGPSSERQPYTGQAL